MKDGKNDNKNKNKIPSMIIAVKLGASFKN